MKPEIALATISGKAYYLVVKELKEKDMLFLSLVPGESIPTEIKVVITTKEERHFINHEKVLTYEEGVELTALINEALRIVQGKEHFEKIVIGVDPGKVFGLAVLADGKIIETTNCFSVEETIHKIESVLRNIGNAPTSCICVKIGDGVPDYKGKLLNALDKTLPPNVVLETVSEAGTNRNLHETKHRRGLRDIVSATRIAGRNGQKFSRRNGI